MFNILSAVTALLVSAGGKLILAALIFIIGRIVLSKILDLVQKTRSFEKLDPTVRAFFLNFIKIALYVVLIISIISVLGVPMASVITVLASAGVAVGLALQGALSNLAGGIMLLIFRPLSVGDYVATAGEEGTVREITLFYTVLITVDNRKITIPNGSLMNANITNYSAEPTRRVDLVFSCGKGNDVQQVKALMQEVMAADERILKTPAPFAELSGGTNEAMEFTLRAWVSSSDYWDVYFSLTQKVTEALGAAGVTAPAVRVITDNK